MLARIAFLSFVRADKLIEISTCGLANVQGDRQPIKHQFIFKHHLRMLGKVRQT